MLSGTSQLWIVIMNNTPDLKNEERVRRQAQISEPINYYDAPTVGAQDNHQLRHQQAALLSKEKQRSLVTYNHITYLLYVLSYFTAGILWIVPIVMNYGKRHDADNTWLATHFDWQIKTFWYSIVLFVIGITLIAFAIGGLGIGVMTESNHLAIGSVLLTGLGLMIIAFTVIWHLYRIIRGWIALTDNRPVP